MLFSREEILELSTVAEKLSRIAGRAPGYRLSAIDEARARVMYQKMMSRTAKRGELVDIATGKYDEEIGLSETSHKPTPTGRCKDCLTDIRAPGSTMKSDPSRCVSCRRAKKRAYNAAQRNGGS